VEHGEGGEGRHAYDARTTILIETFTGGKGGGLLPRSVHNGDDVPLPKKTDAEDQMKKIDILTT